MYPTNRVRGIDAAARPRRPRVAMARDELDHETRGIAHGDGVVSEPPEPRGDRETPVPQTIRPETQRPFGHRERRRADLTGAMPAGGHAAATVRERRPDRAGRPNLGAVIEVIDVVVVEVDGLLDQAKAQRRPEEIQVGLGRVDRRGHVVQSQHRVVHDERSWLASRTVASRASAAATAAGFVDCGVRLAATAASGVIAATTSSPNWSL